MTANQKGFLKNNWLTISNLVLLVSLIVRISMWMQKTDDEILILKEHANSKEIHMPFKEKIKIFSTKDDVVELRKSVEKLNTKIDRLMEYQLRNKK